MALPDVIKTFIIQEVNRRIMPKYEGKKTEYERQEAICKQVNREIRLTLAEQANKMMMEAVDKYPFLSRKEVKRVSLDGNLFLQKSAREVWRRDSENEVLSIAHEIMRTLETDKAADLSELFEKIS